MRGNGRLGGYGWYLLIMLLSYGFQYPPLLAAFVVVLVAQRFLPDPLVLLATWGRVRGLERQIGLNPANGTARRDLALVYLDQRRPGKALARLDEALARFPNDAEMLFLRGAALHALGRNAEATEPLVRAVAVDPRVRFGEPYLVAGDALAAEGRHDEAIDAYDRYLSMQSSSVEAHVKKAAAHKALGERDAAITELRDATSTWGGLPWFQKRRQLFWWMKAHLSRLLG